MHAFGVDHETFVLVVVIFEPYRIQPLHVFVKEEGETSCYSDGEVLVFVEVFGDGGVGRTFQLG